MAKSKHSRALFEVIKQSQAKQQQERRAAEATPFSTSAPRATRSSWLGFLKRGTPAGTTPTPRPVIARVVHRDVAPAEDNPEPQVDHAVGSADAVEQAMAQEVSPTSDVTELTATVDPELDQPVAGDERALLNAEPEAAPESPRRHKASLKGEITITLNYPTLAIAGLAGLMLLISAFLAGKHLARPTWPGGPSLTQLRNGKAFPDVLNVGSAAARGAGDPVAELEAAPPPQLAPPATVEERAETSVPTDTRRVAGRHYIIAQSYPDREIADKAADLLNRNNIPVSVEQLDYAPGWHCVVTRVGFDRIKSSEFERYDKLIRDANVQAATARIKKFDPCAYKWK